MNSNCFQVFFLTEITLTFVLPVVGLLNCHLYFTAYLFKTMKTYTFRISGMFLFLMILSQVSQAQNVGIGTATPLEKLHVIGNIRSSTLAGVGSRLVLSDLNGTLINATGLGSPAWMTTGNTGTNGGTISATGSNFIGTTDNQNICFRTNNIERGRFSSLGEFFVGTFNTVIVGDLMNAVGNPTFPWAVNGYVPAGSNGGGVYGQVQGGNSTVFASVQGEYYGTNAGGAGVRGIAGTTSAIGVQGTEPSLVGWAGLFNGDIGAILPGNFYTVSDQRLKTNVKPLESSLNKILSIRGYSYDANKEDFPKHIQASRRTIGFLAQELEAIIPEAVTEKQIPSLNVNRTAEDKDVELLTVKAVSYDSLIPVLVEAIKEQQLLIEQLRQEVNLLKSNKN